MSLAPLLAIAAVAIAAPLVVGLFPRLRIPAVVVEIGAGAVLGPSALGLVRPNRVTEVLAALGLGFLLFLAGLEIDFSVLRGRLLRLAATAFGVSLLLAVVVAYALSWSGLVAAAPLLVACALVSTSLGLLVPVLKDAGEHASDFGQLVFAAGTLAEFGCILALSVFFSHTSGSVGSVLLLMGGFAVLALLATVVLRRAWRSTWMAKAVAALEDTTAQLRVRAAVAILVALAVLAGDLGLESILGAFLAGVILRVLDTDGGMTSALFRMKLDAIGFGFLIPVFFVSTGLTLDLGALFADRAAILLMPLLLIGILAVRGVPAVLYRRDFGGRRATMAGLLQATSLTTVIVAAHIGVELGHMDDATAAALIAAGVLSVLIFPSLALAMAAKESAAPTEE